VFAGRERRTYLCSECGTKWPRDGKGAKNIIAERVSPTIPPWPRRYCANARGGPG